LINGRYNQRSFLTTARWYPFIMPTRFRLKPTFPLDENAIRLRKLKLVFQSPLTGISLIGALVVGKIAGFGWPGVGTLLGAASAGLFAYWKKKNDELDNGAISELVRESNLAQDSELLRITTVLRQRGHLQYSNSLGRFLLLKQRIEDRLHQDGSITNKKKEIEQLVDSICAGVCDELTELATLEKKLTDVLTSGDKTELQSLSQRQTECHNRVMHAYSTLSQTAGKIDEMLRPSVQPAEIRREESRVLDRLIEELKEENEVTARVQQRLRKEGLMGGDF
jgi:hypothetical protein